MPEFLDVVGSRRSIRWFRPWQPVPEERIQRVLEVARMTGSPGNIQPWRAVVVTVSDLAEDEREKLLTANNHQGPQLTAPVWIYWFGDPTAFSAEGFLHWTKLGIDISMLAPQHGWSVGATEKAISGAAPAPRGMPALDQLAGAMTPEVAATLAAQETNAACAVAALAAVNEGLGTSLLIAASPAHRKALYEVLDVPEVFVPVWLQLLGYPAERPDAGGQRPRNAFDELFSRGKWGTPFERKPDIVEALAGEGLLQPEAPLPGRAEELDALGRMFGFTSE